MTTPTPGKHPAVGSTPPVSTPFSGSHLAAFSPRGPKSVVPSPQQFKKSPANSNTLYGHPSNSSFGAMGFDSPTAAALGMVPALGDLTLDAVTGVGLAPLGRGDEDERRGRLGAVIEILKSNKGRVSEEGIERLTRRVGLECLWETHMRSAGGVRTLIVAGTGLALDIDCVNNMVVKVSLSFPDSSEAVTRHAAGAGQILLRELQLRPRDSPLTKMLDSFAVNLERLAALDKLSVFPTLNCYEAVAGIYESLKKLHEWEKERLREEEMAGKSDEQIVRAALCTRSGRPVMNARDNVGLSLEYWQERHERKTSEKNSSKQLKTWSLIIECAPSTNLVYPSLRVSSKWLSPSIQKSNPTADDLLLAHSTGPVLDWLDPENIFLPATDLPKQDSLMDGLDTDPLHKLPEVIFMAKFDPPLAVPYNIAMQLHHATGAQLESYQLVTFDSLLLPSDEADMPEVDGSHRRIQRVRKVVAFDKQGNRTLKSHENTLSIPKLEYGRLMTELPFSHPRQLVDILPILRQYARLSSLIRTSFLAPTTSPPTTLPPPAKDPQPPTTAASEFTSFLSSSSPSSSPGTLPVEFSLHTQPTPNLRLCFPLRDRGADVGIDVGVDGALVVTTQNVDRGTAGAGKLGAAELAGMLDVAEDVGVWIEFLRSRVGA